MGFLKNPTSQIIYIRHTHSSFIPKNIILFTTMTRSYFQELILQTPSLMDQGDSWTSPEQYLENLHSNP